ncbi:MAG: Uncharacterised protein [Pseudidiomarina mangrovi]|nr:MAG: Uncharacterised protein [Pseudidiomarina mangrovi]
MIRFTFTLLISVLLTSCGAASGMNKAFNSDDWITHRVEIGDKVLRFSVPRGQEMAYIEPPAYYEPDSLELARTDQLPPSLYMAHWTFGARFWKQPEGTLSLKIKPSRGPLGFDKDVRDLKTLEQAIWLWDVAYYRNALNEELTGEPEPFKPTRINGVDWLAYTNYLHKTYMAVPLDRDHYLYVVVDLSLNERSQYFPKAKAMAERIVQSFELEPLSKK